MREGEGSEAPREARRAVEQLAEEVAEHAARAFPERATAAGDHRFDDRFRDLSLSGAAAVRDEAAALRERVRALAGGTIVDEDRASCAVLLAQLDGELARLDGPLERCLLDPNEGPQVTALEILEEDQPLRDRLDGERLLARLAALPRHLDDHGARLADGLAAGLTAPRRLAERTAAQLDALTDGEVARRLGTVLDELAASLGAREGRGDPLVERGRRLVAAEVVPAYRRLQTLVRERLLPAARDEPGLGALPGGLAAYRALASAHTTDGRSPEELQALGERECAAAEEELSDRAAALGFATPAEARRALATPSEAACRSPEGRGVSTEVEDPLAAARALLDAVTARLPALLLRLPAHRCAVAAAPAAQGQGAPPGWYIPPAEEAGSDAHGTFYLNLHPDQRPSAHRVPVITAHEALPGHHLQLCHAVETVALPAFRRRADPTAYVEGWALYAEALVDELGLYDDAARFALAEFRWLRAARLRVDTGLHAFGWSAARAASLLAAHAPLSAAQIEAEIDRYLADPGQALAYTVGAVAFRELRAESSGRLGARFDLPRFHARVLDPGALPLDALRAHVASWDGD